MTDPALHRQPSIAISSGTVLSVELSVELELELELGPAQLTHTAISGGPLGSNYWVTLRF